MNKNTNLIMIIILLFSMNYGYSFKIILFSLAQSSLLLRDRILEIL